MNCLKCGKKVDAPHVFCPDCMAEMDRYPVKPGTVVRLPQRKTAPVEKKRRHIYYSFWKSDDLITTLRTRLRWVTAALIVSLLCLAGAVFLILWLWDWHKYFDIFFWR